MLRKYTYFLVVACIAVLHSNGHVAPLNERDLIDEVTALIEKLGTVIKNAVSSGLNLMTSKIKDIIDMGNSLVEAGANKIQNIVTAAMNDIQEWIGKAEQLQIDVTDCVGDTLDQLKGIPSENLKELTSCLTSNIARLTTIFDQTKVECNKYFDLVTEEAQKVKQCGGGIISGTSCILGIIADVTKLIVQIPLKISGVVTDSIKTMVEVGKDVSLCIADQVLINTILVTDMSKSTIDCIKNKINSHQEKEFLESVKNY